MKILKSIWVLFLWMLYVMVTNNARMRYRYGINEGKHCRKYEDRNGYRTIYYEDKKPERAYRTIKEFFKDHNL